MKTGSGGLDSRPLRRRRDVRRFAELMDGPDASAEPELHLQCSGTVRRHLLTSRLASLAPAEITPGKVENFLSTKEDEISASSVDTTCARTSGPPSMPPARPNGSTG